MTPSPPPPATKRRSLRGVFIGVLLAFLLGAGLVGWLGWQAGFDFGTGLLPPRTALDPALRAAAPLPSAAAPAAPAAPAAAIPPSIDPAQASAEQRLAGLEARLARLDLQAQAASGNAARAEGLLVAFAARRMIERGAPLGYLEDQLKLRFADAQPNAVQTLLDMAHAPVTLDALTGQLQALSPDIAGTVAQETGWDRMKREMAGLFVIRREDTPSAAPQNRMERARLLLESGRVDDAIAQVQLLPGAAKAAAWITAARRYSAAQKALDLIETTALLEPRNLQDAAGQKVAQPSPFATPTPTDSESPVQSAI